MDAACKELLPCCAFGLGDYAMCCASVVSDLPSGRCPGNANSLQ